MYVWYTWSLERGTQSHGTGITDCCKLLWSALQLQQVLLAAEPALQAGLCVFMVFTDIGTTLLLLLLL